MNAFNAAPPDLVQPEQNAIVCPSCKKKDDVYRIPRGKFFKLIKTVVDLKHYRCNRCMKSFYR